MNSHYSAPEHTPNGDQVSGLEHLLFVRLLSQKRPATPRRCAERAAAVLVVLALCSGCATDSSTNEIADRPRASQQSSDEGSAAATEQLSDLWEEMRATVAMPAVPLRPPALRAEAGFTGTDVTALADRAIKVIQRSTDPRLSSMKPAAAVDSVYSGQYPTSTNDFKANAVGYTAGWDWEWLAASRYPTTPSRPRVIKVTGATQTGEGRIDSGVMETYLTVTIQAHIVQTVRTKEQGSVPIVVRRTVRVSSYRPRGGPDWWPTVHTRTAPFGTDGCSLFKGSLLVPQDDAGDLRATIAQLKNSLGSKGVMEENFGSGTDADLVEESVERLCG